MHGRFYLFVLWKLIQLYVNCVVHPGIYNMWPPRIFGNKSVGARQECFLRRNAESLLRRQIALGQGRRCNPIRIFTLRELHQPTNDFHPSRGLSDRWRFYWGILDDCKVTILRLDQNLLNELVEGTITEIVILSTIHHKNVVKLSGCCLETRVPLRVLEFLPRVTLDHDMKHNWAGKGMEGTATPPWSTRLQIAIDVASALNYLHSYTSSPIVHKGVRPSAIFLDEDYTAKMAGFCDSVPIPHGKAQVEGAEVSGTIGYMDPEYLLTRNFTEKADTYALGVVLLDLLAGETIHDHMFKHSKKEEDVRQSPVNSVESSISEDGTNDVVGGISKRGDAHIFGELLGGETREDNHYNQPKDMWRSPVRDVDHPIWNRQYHTYSVSVREYLADTIGDALALGDAEGKTEQFRAFVDLALTCCRRRAQERPTMKLVVEELKRIKISTMALP